MFSHFSFAFSRLLILPIVLSYTKILMTTVAITEKHPSSSYGYETTTIKQFPHLSVSLDRLSNYSWLHVIKTKLIHYIRNTYEQLKAILMRRPVFTISSWNTSLRMTIVLCSNTTRLSHVLRWRTNENQASNSIAYCVIKHLLPHRCWMLRCMFAFFLHSLALTFHSLSFSLIFHILLYRHSSHLGITDDAFTHKRDPRQFTEC